MNFYFKKLTLLLPILLLLSCSVQKRKYQKGFYVNWHKNAGSQENKATLKPVKRVLATATIEPIEAISKTQVVGLKEDNTKLDLEKELSFKPKKTSLKSIPNDSCSTILFRNGDEVKAQVIELTSTEVKYKKCSLEDGPLYVSRKSEIFMITYPNGVREKFAEPAKGLDDRAISKKSGGKDSNKKDDKRAVLSMVLGITGCIFYFGSIPAIILGLNALNDIRREPNKYTGESMAIAGITLGILKLILLIVIIGFAILSA